MLSNANNSFQGLEQFESDAGPTYFSGDKHTLLDIVTVLIRYNIVVQ